MAAPIKYFDLTEGGKGNFFEVDPNTFQGTYVYADGRREPITAGDSIAAARQQYQANLELQGIQQRNVPTAAAAAPVARTQAPLSATDAAALQDFNKFSQRRDLTRSLGPAALIGGIGAAAQLGQVIAPRRLGNIQDRYAAEELDRLQALERRGQLGLTEGERGEMERQMMDPVRTMSRDIQRAGEAERASSGVVTSAASQVRADRERQRLIADQARQAGAQIAQADMAKADQQMRKMEQLIAYKGQRSQQAIANLQKTGMDIAYLAGLARAGKAMEQIDPSGLMSVAPDADSAVRLSKQLTRAQDFGGISQREIEQIAKRNDISSDGVKFLIENYATQTQPSSLADTFTQGRRTEAEQTETEVARMTPASAGFDLNELFKREQLGLPLSPEEQEYLDSIKRAREFESKRDAQ
tara:strand:+ start:3856 stop:5094 length:1239 start_codon:yes stop_codon:yes gene_type:complete